MKAIKLFEFHKSQLKARLYSLVYNNKLRYNGTEVLSGAIISRKVKVYPDNKFGRNCRISDSVQLSHGVCIGNYTSLNKISIGENSIIESWVGCTGHGDGRIIIGKESYIGILNILDSSNNIVIGDFVHIAGPSTGLWTHSSAPMCYNSIPLKRLETENRPTAPIRIESNVYIGGNCTIYPGVKIGHHSVIAPNSAVTKDVAPYTMVGGTPAKFIKKIKLLHDYL